MNCWPFHSFIKCAFFTFHQMPFAACQSVTIALPRVILECTTHHGVVEWMVLSFNWHKHQDPIVLLTLLKRGNNNLAETTARVLKEGASLIFLSRSQLLTTAPSMEWRTCSLRPGEPWRPTSTSACGTKTLRTTTFELRRFRGSVFHSLATNGGETFGSGRIGSNTTMAWWT